MFNWVVRAWRRVSTRSQRSVSNLTKNKKHFGHLVGDAGRKNGRRHLTGRWRPRGQLREAVRRQQKKRRKFQPKIPFLRNQKISKKYKLKINAPYRSLCVLYQKISTSIPSLFEISSIIIDTTKTVRALLWNLIKLNLRVPFFETLLETFTYQMAKRLRVFSKKKTVKRVDTERTN